MKRLLRWLDEVIWPRGLQCLCCDVNSEGQLLCPDCRKALTAMKLPENEQGDEGIRSVYRYDGIVRQLVYMLKLDCQTDAAEVLAEDMADAVRAMNLPENTVLTWVTMPELRRKKRGIDHGRELCEAVARRVDRPVRQLLVRVGNGHTQRGLNREKRLKNIARSIRCDQQIDVPVLMIDDVLTTGATASVCAEALRRAGAPQVFVLTACRVVLKRRYFQIWKG